MVAVRIEKEWRWLGEKLFRFWSEWQTQQRKTKWKMIDEGGWERYEYVWLIQRECCRSV